MQGSKFFPAELSVRPDHCADFPPYTDKLYQRASNSSKDI